MIDHIGDCKFITPFGPTIMVHQCPDEIVEKLNDYVHLVDVNESIKNVVSSFEKNVPDLLNRGLENVFLFYDYCVESGICEYIEELSEIYCNTLDIPGEYKLSILERSEKAFLFSKDIKYADCWVNRYRKGDYTPLHKHGSELSGIIFLKIPDSIREISKDEGIYEKSNLGGILHFSHTFDIVGNISTWIPEHEEGLVLLFPSWLQHIVYPQVTDEERRTFSFNLISKSDFELRNKQFER
jgi:hypothetical protein